MKPIKNYKPAGRRVAGKLSALGLALAVFGASVPKVHAGKAEAIALAAEKGLEYAEKLVTLLSGVNRSVTIVIQNNTDRKLTNLRVHAVHGKCLKLDRENTEIAPWSVGGTAFEKNDSAFYGTEGVITYQIEGTPYKFALMFSVPYNQAGHGDPLFGLVTEKGANCQFAVIGASDMEASEALFNLIYDSDTYCKVAGKGVENFQLTNSADPAVVAANTEVLRAGKANRFQDLPALTEKANALKKTLWTAKGTMVNAGTSKIYIELNEGAE